MDATRLSTEDLVDNVRTWAARISRGTAELLDLIGELDAREAWAAHGITSCAHWLSWQLGWSDTTSREHVRVARALRELPLIRAALHEGELSYSQARGITRIATRDDEPSWLELAKRSTGAQLDKIARGADRARAADTPEEERAPKRGALVEWDDDGDLVLTLRLPAHQAPLVLEALEQQQKAEQADRDERLKDLLEHALTPVTGASAEAEQLPLLTLTPDGQPALTGEARVGAEPAPAVSEDADPAAGASAEAPDLLADADARGHDPLRPYPYVEPPYPIGPARLGLQLSPAEEAAVEAWYDKRDHARAVRDAWNDRCERLLLAASAARIPTGKATLADGLVRLLSCSDQQRTTLRLMVDPLSGWGRTQHDELLPPTVLDKLLRELPRPQIRGGSVLDPCAFDQGRDLRVVSPALRRLLGQLDGERCRFPGCRRTRHLHAHHVLYWRDGGRTDLANLILVCSKHHRLIHNHGYRLTLHPDRTLTVTSADGADVEHAPSLPSASAEALPAALALPQPGYGGDRFDLGYAVHVMLQHAA